MDDLARNDDLVNESSPEAKGRGAILFVQNGGADNEFSQLSGVQFSLSQTRESRAPIENCTCGKV